MKQAVYLAVMSIAVFIAAYLVVRNESTTENEKYLKEAKKHVREFETEQEPERLREAYMSLENVVLEQENKAPNRVRLRRECLTLWLKMVQILDVRLDPKFDPDDVPENLIQPPPTSNGVVYPPGADPAKIDDPQSRAEYEKAIAANNAKINNYRMQTLLRRLNEDIPPRAEEFIKNSYTSSEADQGELKTTIDKIIEKPDRKEDLLKRFKLSRQ